jgi:GT2 family glycosyltransferase
MEIIVIDNASSDGSAEMVEQEFPYVHLIRSSTNDGYGVAINSASGVAEGEYLMFLNPDCEVHSGSIDSLLNFCRTHPKVGVASPRLLLSNGEPQSSARRWVSATNLLFEASRVTLLFPRALRGRLMLGTYYQQIDTMAVPWVSGACHLIPRAVWEEVGPLTEETFCGFDDFDYCYRVWKHGYEVWLCADASITHHCSVAVKERWNSWEVEQVAIHNTYVVLESHWPVWRIKMLNLAEIAAYGTEMVRHKIRPRDDYAHLGEEYSQRLRRRIRLTWDLFVGRQQPIRRFQSQRRPTNAGAVSVADDVGQ